MARSAARRAMRTRRHRPRRGGGAYRETTQALLRTFPELPTGPSGRRRTALTPALSDAHSSEPAVLAVSAAEEDTADYHYPDNDGSEEDAGSEFSHYSAASGTDDEMQDVPLGQPRHLGTLPAKVWSKTLSLVSPFDLARLRRTSKFFDELLQQESIWRGSRSNHLPGFPTPVLGLSEVEMLRLLFGYRCMLCNGGRAVKTYWPFRTRCCWDCLVANSTKEFVLRASPDPFPEELLEVLPFGMVDINESWVPNPKDYQSNIGIVRIFWNKDLEDLRTRHQEAKDMLAEGEWLESLRLERGAQEKDIEKIEKFEKIRPGLTWRRETLRRNPDLSAPKERDAAPNGNAHTDDPGAFKHTRIKDLQERCLKIDTSLTPRILSSLPSYQAAIQNLQDLDDHSWQLLRDNLIQDLSLLREQGLHPEAPSKSRDVLLAAGGGSIGSSKHPTSNGVKLVEYAQDVIRKWQNNISDETIPSFAAELLQHCRQQFIADDSMRRKRLTLADMKYVFDATIKPLTKRYRTEMFLCTGCHDSPRWWNFESLVQHFTAKHTYNPNGKAGNVSWGASWPHAGPWRSEPEKAILKMDPEVYDNKPQGLYGDLQPVEAAPKSQPLRLSAHWLPESKSYEPTIPEQRLNELSRDAREAWFQLSNIRGLPPAVHAHFVITRAARKFQTRFAESIPLSIFLEALNEHPHMKPVRGASKLGCLECYRHPGKPVNGASRANRLFPIVSLLQHFDTVHVSRNRSVVAPDWTRDMIKLPHPRVISGLADSGAANAGQRLLLKDVFPWAFPTAKDEASRNRESGYAPKLDIEKNSPSVVVSSAVVVPSEHGDAEESGAGRYRSYGPFPVSQDHLPRVNGHGRSERDRTLDRIPKTPYEVGEHPRERHYPRDLHARPFTVEDREWGGILPRGDGRLDLGERPTISYGDRSIEFSRSNKSERPDLRRPASRPSNAHIMDVDTGNGRAANTDGYMYESRVFPRYTAAESPRPDAHRRRRSRSPSDRDSYRERHALPMTDRHADGHHMPPGYASFQYPSGIGGMPPYYGAVELGDYGDPYRSRPPLDVRFYPPPPPLSTLPFPLTGFRDPPYGRAMEPGATRPPPAFADRLPPAYRDEYYRRY